MEHFRDPRDPRDERERERDRRRRPKHFDTRRPEERAKGILYIYYFL